ncbi:MAG: hypothetical protein IJU87_05720 [Lachnospiraceae bacterium]|nr:hypothetical protein [Lachnospiraceae bacterium]
MCHYGYLCPTKDLYITEDVTSYGPENTTLYPSLVSGEYIFYVHDFSNGYSETSTAMAGSGAKVTVFRGGEPVKTYEITPGKSGTVWNVFRMTIEGSGEPEFQTINTYTADQIYSPDYSGDM